MILHHARPDVCHPPNISFRGCFTGQSGHSWQPNCTLVGVQTRNPSQILKLRGDITLRQKIGRNFLPAVASFSLLMATMAWAQTPASPPPKDGFPSISHFKDPLNRDTPQSAVTAFLESVHAKNYERAAKYLNLRAASQSVRSEGPDLARRLGQILDRNGQFDVAALSRQPEGEAEPGLPPN